MEEFNFGLFDDLLESEPYPLEIEEFEDELDYKLKLKEKKLNLYEPTSGETRLHRAIRSGKQIEINALLDLYQEDFDRVRDHLMLKYQWNVEDKIWLSKTILVANTEEQCQSAKNLENSASAKNTEELRRAVLVLLRHPVNGEEVAVLHPNEASRSAVTKLITTLTTNGFLSWNFVSTIGPQETFMQVAASKGLKRVIDRLFELGAPISISGHNPLVQAIHNNRKKTVNWLLTEHFDHFDCTLRNSNQHNALIAAIIKNVASLFDPVLEKMIDYRRKYYNETEEEAFHEIFRLENKENEYTSIFEYLRRAGQISERLERAIQKYKLKLSHRWKNYVVLGRLIDRKVALDYCFEGIRNDPQLLALTEYETITILHQLVTEGHVDFVREMYTKHPDVKTYFNTDYAFEVLRKAIHDESRETIQFVLEHHGEFLKCDLDKLRDYVVCCQYYTNEFYEPRRDLLVEYFPEYRENVLLSMEKASPSVSYDEIEDLDKLPMPYSTDRGTNGETLLHLAAYKDDKELFVRLLEDGCDFDALDNDGNHVVHMVKSEEMFDLIVDRHPDGRNIVHRSNNDGCTVLHKVCQQYMDVSTHVDLLEKLIDYGADVHQLNIFGESAVFLVRNSHLLDVLRKHGAQLDVVNQAGETALGRHLANYNVCVASSLLTHLHDRPSFKQHAHQYLAPMMRYNRDFFSCDYQKFLEEHPESASAMFDSVFEHSREEASRLFAKACNCAFIYVSEMFLSGNYDLDYNYKFEFENTPLIGLVNYMEEPNLHLVKQLLEKGVNVQVKNELGRDALLTLVGGFRSARWHGHGLETMQLLLDHGASVHTTDLDGNTPLHLAFANGEMELVEFLVQNGADLGAVDNQGKRPIERASNLDRELFYFYS